MQQIFRMHGEIKLSCSFVMLTNYSCGSTELISGFGLNYCVTWMVLYKNLRKSLKNTFRRISHNNRVKVDCNLPYVYKKYSFWNHVASQLHYIGWYICWYSFGSAHHSNFFFKSTTANSGEYVNRDVTNGSLACNLSFRNWWRASSYFTLVRRKCAALQSLSIIRV